MELAAYMFNGPGSATSEPQAIGFYRPTRAIDPTAYSTRPGEADAVVLYQRVVDRLAVIGQTVPAEDLIARMDPDA